METWRTETTLEAIFLLSSDTIWSFQLIECVLSSEAEEKRATGNWRGTTL